jgi:hypothetical protein
VKEERILDNQDGIQQQQTLHWKTVSSNCIYQDNCFNPNWTKNKPVNCQRLHYQVPNDGCPNGGSHQLIDQSSVVTVPLEPDDAVQQWGEH